MKVFFDAIIHYIEAAVPRNRQQIFVGCPDTLSCSRFPVVCNMQHWRHCHKSICLTHQAQADLGELKALLVCHSLHPPPSFLFGVAPPFWLGMQSPLPAPAAFTSKHTPLCSSTTSARHPISLGSSTVDVASVISLLICDRLFPPERFLFHVAPPPRLSTPSSLAAPRSTSHPQ